MRNGIRIIEKKEYGGVLLRTRRGRAGPRPLSSTQSMHLVLRSSQAKGAWSFRREGNAKKIQAILEKFSIKYRVRILSLANVGNHLHLHLRLKDLHGYKPFIRAVTAAIAMAISGVNRWSPRVSQKKRFWDYRPYTKVVQTYVQYLRLKDYLFINQMEGEGLRAKARALVAWKWRYRSGFS